jgi:hypothetical protein
LVPKYSSAFLIAAFCIQAKRRSLGNIVIISHSGVVYKLVLSQFLSVLLKICNSVLTFEDFPILTIYISVFVTRGSHFGAQESV